MSRQLYLPCPNGCSGEVPLDVETTDDGAADEYGPCSYLVARINDVDNARSHDSGCPPLTPTQRDDLEIEGCRRLADPHEVAALYEVDDE